MPTTDTLDPVENFEAVGLRPAEEVGAAWVGRRHDAAAELPDGRLVLADLGDGEVRLSVTTASGVIFTEARFGDDPIGWSLFGASVRAILAGAR